MAPLRRKIALASAVAVAIFCLGQTARANDLPDIGTAAVGTLSLQKEAIIGDFYMRQMRGTQPLVNDPLLADYIQQLGYRLLANASSINFPYTFFLVNNPEINAFAFFGGHIGINTGLFLYADQESELASVFAHEIAHVTQRHLARMMEAQAKAAPATMAAIAGSILLAIVNPQAGMAGLSGTMAASQQSSINYTRANEEEADRIGIKNLAASGFDPRGMPEFFGKMAAKYRFSSKPPQMLLTHPLPESRISDARNRAEQYPKASKKASLQFELAKARVTVRFNPEKPQTILNTMQRALQKQTYNIREAAEYGYALALTDTGNADKARELLTRLNKNDPNNLYYIDTLTDLDVRARNYKGAEERLQQQLLLRSDSNVININLASVYIEQQKFTDAASLLEKFQPLAKDNMLVYSMMIQAYQGAGKQAQMHQAKAEQFALVGAFSRAIKELHVAHPLLEGNVIEQSRVEERIRQFRELENQLKNL
ncbi:M48 family peptidase [Corallincola spongiicola]|uniref:Putative beta-barrel assembly-enhancing protease n=1 Tax=Corallincola spongiicola TaxID=2520508 RepID=A0ABY1WW94_9GAMM|nr:M48 family peptidase [Corallincola spongiicola]